MGEGAVGSMNGDELTNGGLFCGSGRDDSCRDDGGASGEPEGEEAAGGQVQDLPGGD